MPSAPEALPAQLFFPTPPLRADIEKLGQMFDVEEVRAFLALRDARFQFYYMPNG